MTEIANPNPVVRTQAWQSESRTAKVFIKDGEKMDDKPILRAAPTMCQWGGI
jgi:hypothetical protein